MPSIHGPPEQCNTPREASHMEDGYPPYPTYELDAGRKWDCSRHKLYHAITRELVWEKTMGHCHYCGVRMNPFRNFHIDHSFPRSQGGEDCIVNYAPCCSSCNSSKGGRTYGEWGIRSWHHTLEAQRYMIRTVSIDNLCTCIDEEDES